MSKPEELQEALHIMSKHLKFVLQSRNPKASGAEGEWKTRWDIGPITGKKAAKETEKKLRKEHPELWWRTLKKNEADAYEEGLQVGRRIQEAETPRRMPLLALPENI
jgi:hypothetical protein